MDYYRLIRPLLHALPPEAAHKLALQALRLNLVPRIGQRPAASLSTRVFGLSFPSPVGLAAGFDKNAQAVDAMLAQGFGFVEAGGVTPRPQAGNPKPRMFRLSEDEAVINRMGLNGFGMEAFAANLRARKTPGIVGANLGKNKDSADAAADYVALLEAIGPLVDYVTINISSPNTEGLRALQAAQALRDLLSALLEKRAQMQKKVPILVKIAPDLDDEGLEALVSVAMEKGIEGLVVANTTVARPESLRNRNKLEKGGLSGRPLFELSTQMLRKTYRLTKGNLPLVGVGGISSGADAYAKIRAGASLVQLYTALVYQGFGLLNEIHRTLAASLERDGFKSISEAVGADFR